MAGAVVRKLDSEKAIDKVSPPKKKEQTLCDCATAAKLAQTNPERGPAWRTMIGKYSAHV